MQAQEAQQHEQEGMTMEDPVWGKFTAPPEGYKPHTVSITFLYRFLGDIDGDGDFLVAVNFYVK